MGSLTKLWVYGLFAYIGYLSYQFHQCIQPPEVPKLDSTWWGPGKPPTKEDTSIRPFKINIPDEVINDLKHRLNEVRSFTPTLEGIQFQYGFNTKTLEKIVDHWKKKYDWRDREAFLNKYPQYKTTIQGLDMHYLHVKPQAKQGVKVLPLLLLHGWPGSVREFYEIIPLLTTQRPGQDFVFEVIAPSLPGYGFSQGAVRPGMGAGQVAVIMNNLMDRIGFKRYYLQGGDWGALIAKSMAILYPERVIGVHTNMCMVNSPMSNLKTFLGSLYPSLIVDEKHAHKMYPLGKIFSHFMEEFGYMHIQATKPDTVGIALNDSPVGLAAYIIEKFAAWTNLAFKEREDGGLTEKYTYDKLLDNIMIYWVTNSITTSMRLYAESFSKAQMSLGLDRIPIQVPSACAKFEHELAYQPDSLLKEVHLNLVQSTDFSVGGHFAAFEEPKLLADDVWSAIAKIQEGKRDSK